MGGRETAEHYTWRAMHARCTNPNQASFPGYGGRGITVCAKWKDYLQFLADMGPRPAGGTLERIDTDGGYAPDNCRWASRSEQQKNRRDTRRYTDGVFSGTLVECAAHIGISKELAHYRWKTHQTFEKGKPWRELQKNR